MDFENAETLTEVDDTFVTLSRCNKSFIEKVQFWARKYACKTLSGNWKFVFRIVFKA